MNNEPAFRSPADKQRYYSFFDGGAQSWPLTPTELALARLLFSASPSLRRITRALNVSGACLRIAPIRRWAGNHPERKVLLGAALTLITIPHLARALFSDPAWSVVVHVLDPADVSALASAQAMRATQERALTG